MDELRVEYSKDQFVALTKEKNGKIDISVLQNETPLLNLLAKCKGKNCSHVQGNVNCNYKSKL